jgi:hypothetical protein
VRDRDRETGMETDRDGERQGWGEIGMERDKDGERQGRGKNDINKIVSSSERQGWREWVRKRKNDIIKGKGDW